MIGRSVLACPSQEQIISILKQTSVSSITAALSFKELNRKDLESMEVSEHGEGNKLSALPLPHLFTIAD